MLERPGSDDERAALLAYLAAKCGVSERDLIGDMPHEILAAQRFGNILGAVLYLNFRGHSIEMVWAGEPGWLTRSTLRDMFGYPFNQLGCLRVHGVIDRRNSASRSMAARLGCREAGVLEHEYGLGLDGILYTMTRDRCAWHRGKQHGQEGTEGARSLQDGQGADRKQHRHRARAGAPRHDRADKRLRLH